MLLALLLNILFPALCECFSLNDDKCIYTKPQLYAYGTTLIGVIQSHMTHAQSDMLEIAFSSAVKGYLSKNIYWIKIIMRKQIHLKSLLILLHFNIIL